MTTVDELKVEETTAVAEMATKLALAKRCAICKEPLGDLNGPEGEKYLRIHYERDHPGETIRTELDE